MGSGAGAHRYARRRAHDEIEIFLQQQPGYVAPSLDAEDFDFYDERSIRPVEAPVFPQVGSVYH